MALILDTSILIAGERRGFSLEEILFQIRAVHGETDIALSAVSIVELTHGIYRAKSEAASLRRRIFVEKASRNLMVHPLSLDIASLAGRIEGEQAARGFAIPFQDLIIGCTALHLDFSVATLNTRHFELIPGLTITSL